MVGRVFVMHSGGRFVITCVTRDICGVIVTVVVGLRGLVPLCMNFWVDGGDAPDEVCENWGLYDLLGKVGDEKQGAQGAGGVGALGRLRQEGDEGAKVLKHLVTIAVVSDCPCVVACVLLCLVCTGHGGGRL